MKRAMEGECDGKSLRGAQVTGLGGVETIGGEFELARGFLVFVVVGR